jgi:hypothetical protein
MRARGSVDAQIPVRGYFLWVGGALLVLLFAAEPLLPAPLPSKLIESHSTLPPIRITSELKGPEAVVIDTSQPGFLPTLPDKEIAGAPSPPLSSEVADAVRQPPASLAEKGRNAGNQSLQALAHIPGPRNVVADAPWTWWQADEHEVFTNILNELTTTFSNGRETGGCYSLKKTERQLMSSMVRIATILLCAYAGISLGAAQFGELAESAQMTSR